MSLTPRSVSTSVPTNAPSARQSSVQRGSSSSGNSPVEETGAQVNVSFDSALLFQSNSQAGDHQDEPSNGKTLVEYSVGNQAFANILEESSPSSGSQAPAKGVRRGFSDYLSRAINIYESNARVIHNSGPDPRGSTISLTL